MVGDAWNNVDLVDQCSVVGEEQIQGCRTGLCDPRWLCDYLIQKVVFDNRQKLMIMRALA